MEMEVFLQPQRPSYRPYIQERNLFRLMLLRANKGFSLFISRIRGVRFIEWMVWLYALAQEVSNRSLSSVISGSQKVVVIAIGTEGNEIGQCK